MLRSWLYMFKLWIVFQVFAHVGILASSPRAMNSLGLDHEMLVWDGRLPLDMKNSDLDASIGPFLTVVKGSTENATHYSTLLGRKTSPTPLLLSSSHSHLAPEQVALITIDNTSIFIPGSSQPQNGFRRTEFIAQNASFGGGNRTLFQDEVLGSGKKVFHFSIKKPQSGLGLNLSHEYQIVFIEPSDGSHVFGVQLGTPFQIPAHPVNSTSHSFKILDHALNILFETPFTSGNWHNFAVMVDWDASTLQVFYSKDVSKLRAVSNVVPNPTVPQGDAGKGEFHVGLLKLPLPSADDTAQQQQDVVHFGIQEGTKEGLLYSGVFVTSLHSATENLT